MKSLVVFALVLATVSAFTAKDTPVFLRDLTVGNDAQLGGRITNGSQAVPGQFPYQAALSLQTTLGSHWCGGSLIGQNWVLTAAHCTDGAYSVTVYLGSTVLSTGSAYTVSSGNIHQHSDYIATTNANDISLINIPYVSYTGTISAIRLPSISPSNETYANSTATTSGWGKTDDSSSVSNNLNYANLPVITNAECKEHYDSSVVTDNTICVSTSNGTSTCHGDSGGPLVLQSDNLLIGVTSFVSIKGCQSGEPVAFVRVTKYLNWIKETSGVFY